MQPLQLLASGILSLTQAGLAQPILPADTLQHTPFRVDNHGFSVELPHGWEPMPDSMVQALSRMASTAGDREIIYAAGFQVGPAQYWLEYPYVLLQVDTLGPISEEEFVDAVAGTDWREVSRRIVDNAGESPVLEDARVNQPVWDSANHVLWMRLSGRNREGQPFEVISAQRLYGRGIIMLHYYVPPGADLGMIEQVVADVMANVTFDRGYEYDPSAAASSGRTNWLGRGVAGALAGAIIGALAALFRRRRNPDAEIDSRGV